MIQNKANIITASIVDHIAEHLDDTIRHQIEYHDESDLSGDDFELLVSMVTKQTIEAIWNKI